MVRDLVTWSTTRKTSSDLLRGEGREWKGGRREETGTRMTALLLSLEFDWMNNK